MALDGYTDQSLPRQARKAELLDAETEAWLARAWRDRRDEAALHRLVTAYLRLAIAMAAKFRRYGAPMNDLIQEASLGLMKAAERFDPDRGVRFSTYAVWWIKAGIQDYVMRNHSLVRTGSTAGQKALFFNLRRVQAKLERAARAEGVRLDSHQLRAQVAAEIGVTLAEVQLMEGRLSGPDASLNAVQAGEEAGREWIDALEDEGPQAEGLVAEAHDQAVLQGWIGQAMRVLTARERHIVAERRLADVPRTLESLAGEMGLSKERVRQLEVAAYAKLRRALEGQTAELVHFLN
jgi:RNA polymerase sigma-32 factor